MSYDPNDDARHQLPLHRGSNGDEQRSTIKNAWSAVLTSPLGEIWSPLAYDVGDTVKRITDSNHDQQQVMRSLNHDEHPNQQPVMQSLIELVSHLMLCLTMTILLPISFLRKLISMKRRLTRTWGWRLAVSCIAISLDALFFYIPFIDEKNKCIGMDRTLRDIALVLRSLIDLAFALHIETLIHEQIDAPQDPVVLSASHDRVADYIRRRRKWLSIDIIIGFVSILPIPQVTIIIALFRMRWYENLDKTMIGNIIFILQICARGYQLYHFQSQLRALRILTASALYLFRYLLTCHMLGALWYFYSIQREISCWHQACRNITGCVATSYCEDNSSSANITLLNEFCPLNSSDATLYDFGIFLGSLKSGNTGPISFWTKYIYTLWRGIKNLSNFGTSLETSHYVWENCFSIIICLVGLVMFIYLLGNMQTYLMSESIRALEDQKTKINAKFQDLDTWLSRNGILGEEKTEVVEIIKQNKVVETNYKDGHDVAVDLDFVFNAIKVDRIKLKLFKHLYQNALEKVTIFQNLSLESDKLKDVAFLKDDMEEWNQSYDLKEVNKAYGELTTIRLEKMDRKEKDIREWLSKNCVPDDLKTSVMKHVEGNHRHVLEKNLDAKADVKYLFSIGLSWDIEYHIKKHLCMSTLRKVPVLRFVDENVLHRICMSLEPVILPENNVVFRQGDEIDRMLIIVEGEINLTQWIFSSAPAPPQKVSVKRVNKGNFCGEELLISAFPNNSIFRSRPAISKKHVECCKKVEAFALTKMGVKSVVAYYRDGINEFEQLENGRDHGVADSKGASTCTTIIEQRLGQLIQLQGDMFQQQATIRDEMGRRLDEMAAFLAILGYAGTPLPPPPAA